MTEPQWLNRNVSHNVIQVLHCALVKVEYWHVSPECGNSVGYFTVTNTSQRRLVASN